MKDLKVKFPIERLTAEVSDNVTRKGFGTKRKGGGWSGDNSGDEMPGNIQKKRRNENERGEVDMKFKEILRKIVKVERKRPTPSTGNSKHDSGALTTLQDQTQKLLTENDTGLIENKRSRKIKTSDWTRTELERL